MRFKLMRSSALGVITFFGAPASTYGKELQFKILSFHLHLNFLFLVEDIRSSFALDKGRLTSVR